MNSMSFAPARPALSVDLNPVSLVGDLLSAVGRLFAPRQPAAPSRLSWRQRAAAADQVRRMAVELQHIDPGMAGDLFAAADRHLADA